MRVLLPVFFALLGGVLLFGVIAPGAAPISVTSPVSDSMEPIAPQHSLVVVTNGNVDVGDIVLYESAQRDAPVLHRAIGETDTGYITQGDANDLSDQALGNDPVTESQIDGVVPTVAGHPVILPYVGGVLTNPVVLVGSWGLFVISLLYTTRVGKITRGGITAIPIRKYGIAFAVILIVGLPVATAVFAIPVQADIVTSTTASPSSSNIAAPGEVSERTVTVSSPLFVVLQPAVIVEGDVTLQDTDNQFGEQSMQITIQNNPSEEPMIHEGSLRVYTYPSVFPGVVMNPVEAIHPVVASFVNALVIGGMILGLTFGFDKHKIVRVGPNKLRNHRNNRTRREQK
jgi:signal peptidase I